MQRLRVGLHFSFDNLSTEVVSALGITSPSRWAGEILDEANLLEAVVRRA